MTNWSQSTNSLLQRKCTNRRTLLLLELALSARNRIRWCLHIVFSAKIVYHNHHYREKLICKSRQTISLQDSIKHVRTVEIKLRSKVKLILHLQFNRWIDLKSFNNNTKDCYFQLSLIILRFLVLKEEEAKNSPFLTISRQQLCQFQPTRTISRRHMSTQIEEIYSHLQSSMTLLARPKTLQSSN